MKKMTFIKALASAAVLAASTASATDVSYDYFELRFDEAEIGSADGDGFQFGGSYNVTDNCIIVGGYQSLDFDGGVELTILEAGGGYVWAIDPAFDLFATGSILLGEVDTNFGDDDETGFKVVGGIRAKFHEQIEARASVNYADLDDSDTFIQLAGDYYFTPQFAAGVSVDLAGDVDSLTFGIRYFFGGRRISK